MDQAVPGVISGIHLAGRLHRLIAFVIDAVLGMGLIVPLYAQQFRGLTGLQNPAEAAVQMQAMATYVPALVGVAAILFVVQVVLLTLRGQTIGKLLLGVKIVKKDTMTNGGFVTNVLLRALVNGLIGMVPFYALVDGLFIFRADRRCIHDLIAGTVVVRA